MLGYTAGTIRYMRILALGTVGEKAVRAIDSSLFFSCSLS